MPRCPAQSAGRTTFRLRCRAGHPSDRAAPAHGHRLRSQMRPPTGLRSISLPPGSRCGMFVNAVAQGVDAPKALSSRSMPPPTADRPEFLLPLKPRLSRNSKPVSSQTPPPDIDTRRTPIKYRLVPLFSPITTDPHSAQNPRRQSQVRQAVRMLVTARSYASSPQELRICSAAERRILTQRSSDRYNATTDFAKVSGSDASAASRSR